MRSSPQRKIRIALVKVPMRGFDICPNLLQTEFSTLGEQP
jgi:hypothetical protein